MWVWTERKRGSWRHLGKSHRIGGVMSGEESGSEPSEGSRGCSRQNLNYKRRKSGLHHEPRDAEGLWTLAQHLQIPAVCSDFPGV